MVVAVVVARAVFMVPVAMGEMRRLNPAVSKVVVAVVAVVGHLDFMVLAVARAGIISMGKVVARRSQLELWVAVVGVALPLPAPPAALGRLNGRQLNLAPSPVLVAVAGVVAPAKAAALAVVMAAVVVALGGRQNFLKEWASKG
jgi:hypothetical protein